MSSGRKKTKAPTIAAPPQVTQYQFNSPTGDLYSTLREGNIESYNSALTAQKQRAVQTSNQALSDLADDLSYRDSRRAEAIESRARDFYDLQADAINSQANDMLSTAKSDLSKRFGGTYNATFGNDFLARMEKNRLNQLSGASKEASLLAEDMYQQDETSRLNRFILFQNFLNDEHNKALNVAGFASDVLQNEANRAQELAIQRASLAQRANEMNAASDIAARNRRASAITQVALSGLKLFGV